ncbi:MAG: DNA primase [Clostridia bacterium]|nr:DNA primase [Clostridia bacterium]
MISQNIIAEIKYRNPIESVIGDYVNLTRRGTTMVGLCPFHSEKTPSFTVWPQKGSYYCFGCGAGGDVITFIRQIEALEYVEALELLAKRAGITIPHDDAEQETARVRMRLLELNRFAARFFHESLYSPRGAEAMAYLKSRRFSDKTIKTFGLGYADEDWTSLTDAARKAGFRVEELTTAFLSGAKNGRAYDIFRKRIMFPIIEPNGNVVAFAGRRIHDADSDRKYVNTNNTPVFNKRNVLFALNLAKKAKSDFIILTEGPTDTISLHQAGFTQTVASQGTALTQEHARLLTRYTKEVVLAYDDDKAGRAATERAYDILRSVGLNVRVLQKSADNKDPDEFIKAHGAEAFERRLEASIDALSHRINQILAGFDLSVPAEKVEALKTVAAELAKCDTDIEADVYADRVAKQLEIDKGAILREVRRKRSSRQRAENRRELRVTPTPGQPLDDPQRDPMERGRMGIVRYVCDSPDNCERVRALTEGKQIFDEFWQEVFDGVCRQIRRGEAPDVFALKTDYSPAQAARLSRMLSSEAHCHDMAETGMVIQSIYIEGLRQRAMSDPSQMDAWLTAQKGLKT